MIEERIVEQHRQVLDEEARAKASKRRAKLCGLLACLLGALCIILVALNAGITAWLLQVTKEVKASSDGETAAPILTNSDGETLATSSLQNEVPSRPFPPWTSMPFPL